MFLLRCTGCPFSMERTVSSEKYGRQLYDRPTAPLQLKVRMHDVDTRPGALREAADSPPPTPATNHRFQPSPTLRPCMCCHTRNASNRPTARASNVRPQEETVIRRCSSQEVQRVTATSGDVRGAFRGGRNRSQSGQRRCG